MNMIEVCDMAFEADIAGASEESRVSVKVVTEVIKGTVKIITELLQ